MMVWLAVTKPSEAESLSVLPPRFRRLLVSPRYARSLLGARIQAPIFLDSGAQQFTSAYSHYPAYWQDYVLKLARALRAEFVASLDYPADILLPRGWSLSEVLEGTARGARRLLEAEGVQAKKVLVLQGVDEDSFIKCLDLIGCKEHRYWGLGGLCMERDVKLIASVARAVRRELGRDAWIHVFGPRVDSWPLLKPYVDSVDTSMWMPSRPRRLNWARPAAWRPKVRVYGCGKEIFALDFYERHLKPLAEQKLMEEWLR